jgi:hypothetical protein
VTGGANSLSLVAHDPVEVMRRDLLSSVQLKFAQSAQIEVAQREDTVAGPRGSPSETQALGSACDCRFTKR